MVFSIGSSKTAYDDDSILATLQITKRVFGRKGSMDKMRKNYCYARLSELDLSSYEQHLELWRIIPEEPLNEFEYKIYPVIAQKKDMSPKSLYLEEDSQIHC